MKDVNVYPDDFKLKVVQHYFDTDDGFNKTAKKFNIPAPSTVRTWVSQYKAESLFPETLASKQKLEYVPEDIRRKIVKHYIENGDSIDKTAKKFNKPLGSVRKWIDQYKHEFRPSTWRKTTYGNVYERSFKLEVVRHYVESDDGLSETARKFNMPHSKSITNWVAKFGQELYPPMSKPVVQKKAVPEQQTSTSIASSDVMTMRIQQLESALKNEQLINEATNLLIDVAEKELNISIRKKSGAKQLKK